MNQKLHRGVEIFGALLESMPDFCITYSTVILCHFVLL